MSLLEGWGRLKESATVPIGVVVLILGVNSQITRSSDLTVTNSKEIAELKKQQNKTMEQFLEITTRLSRIEGFVKGHRK